MYYLSKFAIKSKNLMKKYVFKGKKNTILATLQYIEASNKKNS